MKVMGCVRRRCVEMCWGCNGSVVEFLMCGDPRLCATGSGRWEQWS